MKPNGVTEYARCTVDINFPNKEVRCMYCPLLETYARNQCRRTGDYIIDTRGIGMWCPLKMEEEHGL